jgi:hypothetical protein
MAGVPQALDEVHQIPVRPPAGFTPARGAVLRSSGGGARVANRPGAGAIRPLVRSQTRRFSALLLPRFGSTLIS